MEAKINYTAYLVNDWECVVEKHLFALLKSGLYGDCSRFNVFAYPKNEMLISLLKSYGMEEKTEVYFQEKNRYEFPAILDLIENPLDFNLYFHTKGVSLKENKKSYVPALAWNDYMSYFLIWHYRTCLELLKANDAVGVELGASLSEPNKWHYSGNFWWTTKAHLETIRNSSAFLDLKTESNRYQCETIVGSVPGNYIELFNSGTNTPKTGRLYFYPILDYGLFVDRIKRYSIIQ